MSKQIIKIERLQIRLRGISPAVARSAVSGLGETLLDQLGPAANLSGEKRVIKIANIDPGAVQLAAGTRPSELRSAIAGSIAASIKSKLQ
jgi:hypothetical protein